MEASGVRVSGPLAGWAPELIRWLAERRYSAKTSVEYVRWLEVSSRRLDHEGQAPAAVDDELVAAMVARLHAAGSNKTLTPAWVAVGARVLASPWSRAATRR